MKLPTNDLRAGELVGHDGEGVHGDGFAASRGMTEVAPGEREWRKLELPAERGEPCRTPGSHWMSAAWLIYGMDALRLPMAPL